MQIQFSVFSFQFSENDVIPQLYTNRKTSIGNSQILKLISQIELIHYQLILSILLSKHML